MCIHSQVCCNELGQDRQRWDNEENSPSMSDCWPRSTTYKLSLTFEKEEKFWIAHTEENNMTLTSFADHQERADGMFKK
jgi:hypothetical protein